ncbi:glycoside hydrolase family 65 protein [Pedobacter caeni]|uniref:Maltose phosphorylase n=1 Tax=Pedobacter caeni TaxID=288992 RepID=A0A1M4T6U2_9SPHI|nr:glycoside hydrolase family 65 protein [Pedobacter caeni]SHE40074.1 maltose phosphorylase [Pedobacter caeni]
MKNYIKANEWKIIEEGFDPHLNKISESIFSLGNGRMGQRANFEETYTGDTLQGNYIAGVYYPDKTRVGWWKNGYPESLAKVINAANWIGLNVTIDGETLDLAQVQVSDFKRELNMREGYLLRSFTARLKSGKAVSVTARRFCSIANDEVAALRYSIRPLNFRGTLTITAFTDGDVKNQDSNYGEKFWEEVDGTIIGNEAYLTLRTKKTAFEVCTGSSISIFKDGSEVQPELEAIRKDKYVGQTFHIDCGQHEIFTIDKVAANLSSENHPKPLLMERCKQVVQTARAFGFEALLNEQAKAWAVKWQESDILIEGDVAAQQAIRFNIFQLFQTYTGKDDRLNIGPKGFTGEKYGGSTFWDTEAYCLPFYLATAEPAVARNLLIYRYKQLGKAIENAEKLGFSHGAALYPMVTMNGEECHNEWEITFEEIHRNGAIAFAIYNYVRYTNDTAYLQEYGLEVLVAIARFWKQRVNWSNDKHRYVILGVTGPNEYENNVDNNWYTNLMASWCLKYASEVALGLKAQQPQKYMELLKKLDFKEKELADWAYIVEKMYYPQDSKRGIFLQQDGYLDKEPLTVKHLSAADRPLNQKWSWDRILRSCFIKQADVLQGLYFFEEDYDLETIRRNFDYYEPRTVHESSLSPCVHSILAAKLNDEARAYEFYLRTARLDLDDYNNDTEDGLHITSMAGTWMSIVEGFAGMRVRNGQLQFNPFLPGKWESFSFSLIFRGARLNIKITEHGIRIKNESMVSLTLKVRETSYQLAGYAEIETGDSVIRPLV